MAKTQEEIHRDMFLVGQSDEELEQALESATNAYNDANSASLQGWNGTILQYIENEQTRRSQEG
jgi:hypothetical protein